MINKIMSSLAGAATGDFIYSSLSFFARKHGGELPGRWFVLALGPLGIEEQAIRQTLYRMETTGVLLSRRSGRSKWYRASPSTEAILDAGVSRVAEPVSESWDGKWTLVHFRVGEDDRDARDRMRDVLLVEGFAALGPGLYVHARDRSERLMIAARELGIDDRLNIFRGEHVAGMADMRLVHSLWDLASLASRYRAFIRRYERIASQRRALPPRQAFALRFAFMFEFFRITWDDPSLPQELLPENWPAESARATADKLMRRLTPGAIAYAEEILETSAERGSVTGVQVVRREA